MYVSPRRTGRTTRMLECALAASDAGRAVYVVCATGSMAKALEERVNEMRPGGHTIKFEAQNRVGALADFSVMRPGEVRGHPNCEVFWDHYAIENALRDALQELHRYDFAGDHYLEMCMPSYWRKNRDGYPTHWGRP